MLAEIVCFAAFCAWTLAVYLVGKYLGQREAYKAGMSAGFSEGCSYMLEPEDEQESFEQIAGLWAYDCGPDCPACKKFRVERKTILPPKGDL